MASSSIADSVDGRLLAPMPALGTQRKSAATWVEAMCLTAQLRLSLRRTRIKPRAIMPRLSLLSSPIRLSNTCSTKSPLPEGVDMWYVVPMEGQKAELGAQRHARTHYYADRR